MGYSAVLVPAVFGMGEVVVVVQSNYTGQPLWCPVVDARASPNIISGATEPHERIAAESELSKA